MRLSHILACIIVLINTYSSSAAADIDLSGAWDYAFITSEKEYPPSPDTAWKHIELPDRDLFETIAEKNSITKGYILYRKKVIIKELPRENLLFQAGEIMNTDMVFINRKQIGKTGLFPPDFKSGWSKFRNYPIPGDLLIHGENTIDIVNYFNAELWILSPIRIIDEKHGNTESMIKNFIQIDFIHAFCILLLSFSLFFISIYLKRKKEIMYFYYSCATFFLADMTILQFVENLYTYIPLSSDTIYKICGLGPMFFPPFLAFFFRSYLDLQISLKRIAIYLFPSFICAACMLISHDRYYIIYWRNIFLLLIPLYMADITIVSIRQLMAGNRRGLLLFISLVPFFFFGIYDILVFSLHIFEGSVPIYPIGVPMIVVLIGLQLVNRFIANLNASERLNFLLQEKIEEGKRLSRLENEIAIAREIQLANIPHSLPELSRFSISVKYIPAENISGDFYNFHSADQDKLGVLIADVSGHGIPASLISSMVKILFSTLEPVYTKPDKFIKGLSSYLSNKMEDSFLTAGYCYIDRGEQKAVYARAGHEPLLHISRKNGGAELHEYIPHGRFIGFNINLDMEPVEFEIVPGDRLILYTDGIIDVFNDNREIFGRERLTGIIMETKELSAAASTEAILKALQKWNSSRPFDDDFTLIIIDIW